MSLLPVFIYSIFSTFLSVLFKQIEYLEITGKINEVNLELIKYKIILNYKVPVEVIFGGVYNIYLEYI